LPKQPLDKWRLLRPNKSIRDGVGKSTPALAGGARENPPRNDLPIVIAQTKLYYGDCFVAPLPAMTAHVILPP
jgi:hypothetical protein